MAIADQIAELTTIRGDIRTALVGKGVDASTHNFADFADDIDNIPSGGSADELEYLGQLPTSCFVSTDGKIYNTSSNTSTYVYRIPNPVANAVLGGVLCQKYAVSNRGRGAFSESNPLEAVFPLTGWYIPVFSDGSADRIGAATRGLGGNTTWKYFTITVSNQSGSEPKPDKIYFVAV